MNESITPQRFTGKNVVVIGGSKGVGRAIVAAASASGAQVLAVARKAEPLVKLADDFPGVHTLQLDATEESAPAKVFATLFPDVLVVCAGATPHTAPLVEQSWEQFSRNWNSDVKMALLFSQAALTTPLPSGTTIILISSGAALGGSPMSGGYAGSKRTQMFIANYAQQEAERMKLELRFIALVPGGIMPGTDLGKAAVSAYASYRGMSVEDFISGTSTPVYCTASGARWQRCPSRQKGVRRQLSRSSQRQPWRILTIGIPLGSKGPGASAAWPAKSSFPQTV